MVDTVISKSDTERNALWAIREDIEAVVQQNAVFLYDVSLPISNMDEYIRLVNAGIRRRWSAEKCFVIGHLGDGNLHLLVNLGTGNSKLR